ncbi:hypothetical protein FMM75_22655 [Lachnospiraceae bacterium MD335]|nr:hypothetical protein [Lachnospiraceae bacterium MD335]
MKNKELVLSYMGMDSWDRPVYKEPNGRLWKDVSPVKHQKPDLCTSVNNEFDGEPDDNMRYIEKYKGIEVIFVPERVIW